MLYNTELKIAVKDTESRYNMIDTSIFEIESTSKHLPNFQSKITKAKDVYVKVKCPICGEYHEAKYKISDLLKKQLVVGGCELTGSPIFFVGKPMRINKYISKYNEVNSKLYAML
ncbi:hypothetical protein [Clostridium thermarum]|uniref:hypothetical protein n=1 Tax=Clostridium thermarum TaxID=1716543 RepID=UPI0013D44E72|nr:hypothetical protein [Clostridium thermarum]